MPELLKDKLNYESLHEFAMAVQAVYSPFLVEEFIKSTMDETWADLELKARGRQISVNLGKYLPADYRAAIGVIDPSEDVRRSVANNLNDISKTHPQLVVELAKSWYGKNAHTDWIVKHGCRTLLKKGNRDILAIFGYDDVASVDVADFTVTPAAISLGEDITFSFSITVKEATKVRLEYGIDYVKDKGKMNRKIFQISEISLKKNDKKSYSRNHSFADLSTRKHYPGIHSLVLMVNGIEREKVDFEVNF